MRKPDFAASSFIAEHKNLLMGILTHLELRFAVFVG